MTSFYERISALSVTGRKKSPAHVANVQSSQDTGVLLDLALAKSIGGDEGEILRYRLAASIAPSDGSA